MRFRLYHRLYAWFHGYFWLPCPLCRHKFGGHEWETGVDSSIATEMDGVRQGICPDCTRKRRAAA